MPVVRPVSTSAMGIARGWKPFVLYHCVMRSSPAVVHSLRPLRSATVRTGRFENTCSQPPCPQLSSTNPFASARCLRTGVSFSTTAFSSSYDSKKNGMLKTLNAPSILASPTTVSDAPCSASRRILRSTVGSSPCEAPLKIVTWMRSLVACFHSAAICFRFLSQMEPSGTIVASLMATLCASGAGASASTANARTNEPERQDRDITVTKLRSNRRGTRGRATMQARLVGALARPVDLAHSREAGLSCESIRAEVSGHRDGHIALLRGNVELELERLAGHRAADRYAACQTGDRARHLVAGLRERRAARHLIRAHVERDIPLAGDLAAAPRRRSGSRRRGA